jgi:hypothetical protein
VAAGSYLVRGFESTLSSGVAILIRSSHKMLERSPSAVGYGEPRSLYFQNIPHFGFVDISTASEWVADGAACAFVSATGRKTRNGVVSMSADAERDVKAGDLLVSRRGREPFHFYRRIFR